MRELGRDVCANLERSEAEARREREAEAIAEAEAREQGKIAEFIALKQVELDSSTKLIAIANTV